MNNHRPWEATHIIINFYTQKRKNTELPKQKDFRKTIRTDGHSELDGSSLETHLFSGFLYNHVDHKETKATLREEESILP